MENINIDIKQFLDQDQKKDLLRLLTAGSVDDGKSTLYPALPLTPKGEPLPRTDKINLHLLLSPSGFGVR